MTLLGVACLLRVLCSVLRGVQLCFTAAALLCYSSSSILFQAYLGSQDQAIKQEGSTPHPVCIRLFSCGLVSVVSGFLPPNFVRRPLVQFCFRKVRTSAAMGKILTPLAESRLVALGGKKNLWAEFSAQKSSSKIRPQTKNEKKHENI